MRAPAQRDVPDDGEIVAGELDGSRWMIRHQADGGETQVAEDLSSNVVTVGVDGQTEFLVCFDDAAAIILNGVRLDLTAQTVASPSRFPQINDHAGALLLNAPGRLL